MSDISTIKSKIEKLMALSNSPNPAEAASALEKANKLLIQHNIDIEEVTGFKSEIEQEDYTSGYALREHETGLIASIARYNLCEVLLVHNREYAFSGRSKTKTAIRFIGKKHNIVAARVMSDYVFEACDKASLQVKGEGRSVVHSFKVGFCSELNQRIMKMTKANEVQNGGSTALVLVENRKEVQDYMENTFSDLKKEKAPAPVARDAFAFYAGQLAAKTVGLNTQIQGGM